MISRRRSLAAISLAGAWLVGALTLPANAQSADPSALAVWGDELAEVELPAGTVVSQTPLSQPLFAEGLTLSATGRLLVASLGSLYEVDVETGAVLFVGDYALAPDGIVQGLAEDACGRLFLKVLHSEDPEVRLYRLDPMSGATEVMGSLPLSLYGGLTMQGTRVYTPSAEGDAILAIDVDTWGTVGLPVDGIREGTVGADFDRRGDLWWVSGGVQPPVPIPVPVTVVLQQVELATGGVTDHPYELRSPIAISPPGGQCLLGQPQAIPTLSPWALIVLALSLTLAAWWVRRRRSDSPLDRPLTSRPREGTRSSSRLGSS